MTRAVLACLALTAFSSHAALVSQYGILDLTANGGINPNTGVAWADGDQYRLAFHTAGKFDADSTDIAVHNARVTAQANLSTLGNGSITTSTGWTAMVSTVAVNVMANTGTSDLTGGAGIGGAGVPVFAMDGITAIARNNADIWNGWSNPFNANAVIRLASGSTNLNSAGVEVIASQNVHYSPFLDQFGLGDSANVHGVEVWTGANSNGSSHATQQVGSDAGNTQWGSSNANSAGRVWARGNAPHDGTSGLRSFYALSPVLTVTLIPEPSSALLGGIGLLALLRRRR